jgi:hypothetical protein
MAAVCFRAPANRLHAAKRFFCRLNRVRNCALESVWLKQGVVQQTACEAGKQIAQAHACVTMFDTLCLHVRPPTASALMCGGGPIAVRIQCAHEDHGKDVRR